MDLTIEQAQKIIAEHGGYGRVRVYGILAEGQDGEGQIMAIKSDYHLQKYRYSRIYSSNATIADFIS